MKDLAIFGFGFACGSLAAIIYLLLRKDLICDDNEPADDAVYRVVFIEIDPDTNHELGEIKMAEIKEGSKRSIRVRLLTARGNAAAIEPGSGRWISNDESVVSVVQDPADETRAELEGMDGSENESALIEFRADGKRGPGEKEVIASLAVTCTQGDVVVAEMELGDEIEVPAEPTEPNPPAEPEVPGEPTEPTEPTTPAEPGVPTEPGDVPTEPLPPVDSPAEPSEPTEPTGDNR